MQTVHVIGAGLSGLAAALSLTQAGRTVVVHEAGPAGGGRCRSYVDKELGLRIDNGNHLMLSGNRSIRDYLRETNAEDLVRIAPRSLFPFMDATTGKRWTVHPNMGRIPWWIFSPSRSVPETRLSDYIRLARIMRCQDDTTVANVMRRGQLYWRLVEPLAIAALNTPSQSGLARLLGAVMRETLMQGGAACRPILPNDGLSDALVDPAIATLTQRGATIRFADRIAALTQANGIVTALRGPAGVTELSPSDAVVLAVPPWVASDLLPGLVAPTAFEAILNIHYRQDVIPQGSVAEAGFIGIVAGTAEWVFVKRGHVSVTISAANKAVDETPQAIAEAAWPDVVDALQLGPQAKTTMPGYRVVKEKRATFAATAEQQARRPNPRHRPAANLVLAGDWIDTGLPATIEGAIRSGRAAADLILSS